MSRTFSEAFEEYPGEPSEAGLEEIQQWILRHPRYNPHLMLPDVAAHSAEERVRALEGELPAALLSPRLHLELARAMERIGHVAGTERHRRLARLALAGLRASGTGSAEDPIAVLRVQDEYDLLESAGRTVRAQQLSRTSDAVFDVVTLDEGARIWFELLRERPPPGHE